MTDFVAIDFETADHGRDSACAVGLVRARQGRIADTATYLIRPPRQEFVFTYIHGITWEDVVAAPTFAELWPDMAAFMAGADFLVAHNAPFDKGVLNACCAAADLPPPSLDFVCTVRVARRTWGIYPTKLPNVCQHLGIGLDHHDAGSDAAAAASIALAALAEGAAIH